MSQNTSHAVMAQRLAPADSLDYFPTPPWGARALCEHVLELSGASVWESACGAGHMARPLAEYADTVTASDLSARGFGVVHDFLGAGPLPFGRPDWVITNPPFNRLSEFVRVGLAVAARGVAMLCRVQVMEGVGRYQDIFKPYAGHFTIAPFVERLPMEEGCCAADGSTATAYCWLVIDKHQDRPPLVHIPPCRKALERPGDYDSAAFVQAVRELKKARKAGKGGT